MGKYRSIVAELIAGASTAWILDWPGYRKVNVNTMLLRKLGSTLVQEGQCEYIPAEEE